MAVVLRFIEDDDDGLFSDFADGFFQMHEDGAARPIGFAEAAR